MCESRTSCISIRYTGYYVSTTSPFVGSMILLPVTDPRKRGHVLRARDRFTKQDVRATQTGRKISRYHANRPCPGKETCCGNKGYTVTCRAHASIARWSHEHHARASHFSNDAQILFYIYFFLPITSSAKSYFINKKAKCKNKINCICIIVF